MALAACGIAAGIRARVVSKEEVAWVCGNTLVLHNIASSAQVSLQIAGHGKRTRV